MLGRLQTGERGTQGIACLAQDSALAAPPSGSERAAGARNLTHAACHAPREVFPREVAARAVVAASWPRR